jgi:GrpB-like predicted nucleotidyltransferase (UPF0157 family)
VGSLRLRPAAELWPLVDRAFQRHSREIRTLVPAATVEHVGATAIPGSVTKGDVDLLVRVPAGDFAAAAKALRGRYAVDQPENWTNDFASFSDEPDGELPVGIQLVASGSRVEAAFDLLKRELRARPDLVERSNELKRRRASGDPDAYARSKQAFLEAVLSEADPARFGAGTWPWP